MTRWPKYNSDKTGTPDESNLSNVEIIQRIERTVAGDDIKSLVPQRGVDEIIVSAFIYPYLRPLVAAAKEEVKHRSDGVIILPRRTITENSSFVDTISYGFHPAEVAFALRQLHQDVLSNAAQAADRKNLYLSKDILLGFSCVLGYHNLCYYLLQSSIKEDCAWLQRFCDLSVSYSALVSSMDGARTWLANHLPPITASAPDAPCWIILNRSSWYGNFTQEIVDTIISAEKNRLLAFRKSFYMYLTVIAQPSQGIQAGYDQLLDRR